MGIILLLYQYLLVKQQNETDIITDYDYNTEYTTNVKTLYRYNTCYGVAISSTSKTWLSFILSIVYQI